MDTSQPECAKCPLLRAQLELKVPEGCELAWRVHAKLTSPAVQRFGLVEEAFDAMRLELTDEETADLLQQLDAIVEGIDKASAAAAAAARK